MSLRDDWYISYLDASDTDNNNNNKESAKDETTRAEEPNEYRVNPKTFGEHIVDNFNWPYRDPSSQSALDEIKSPTHYKLFDGYEVKDLIKDRLTKEEWLGYIKGNMIKYHMRLGKKDKFSQDLGKLAEYINWLQEETDV